MKVFLALLLFNYSLKNRVKHYVLPSIAFRHTDCVERNERVS